MGIRVVSITLVVISSMLSIRAAIAAQTNQYTIYQNSYLKNHKNISSIQPEIAADRATRQMNARRISSALIQDILVILMRERIYANALWEAASI